MTVEYDDEFHAVKATVLWNILFSQFAMVTQVRTKPELSSVQHFQARLPWAFFVFGDPIVWTRLSITLDPSQQVRRNVSSSSTNM